MQFVNTRFKFISARWAAGSLQSLSTEILDLGFVQSQLHAYSHLHFLQQASKVLNKLHCNLVVLKLPEREGLGHSARLG